MHFVRIVDRKEVKGIIGDERKKKGEVRIEKEDNKRRN